MVIFLQPVAEIHDYFATNWHSSCSFGGRLIKHTLFLLFIRKIYDDYGVNQHNSQILELFAEIRAVNCDFLPEYEISYDLIFKYVIYLRFIIKIWNYFDIYQKNSHFFSRPIVKFLIMENNQTFQIFNSRKFSFG